jgi:hypothetical protein
METKNERIVEIIAVLLVWAVLFMAVVGPAIGAAVPGFDRPALSGDDDSHRGDLPDTARGWLLVILGVPVLLATRSRTKSDGPRDVGGDATAPGRWPT